MKIHQRNFKTDYFYIVVAAVVWLKYCRYGKKHQSVRRFRDRRSSVMEEILVTSHTEWLNKAYIPYMEYIYVS